ncbi:MAG: transpeptidase family protein [Spirochaetales bacterium]|nr:transpeptidase family protein [Spirochaetales bacterium]
MLFGEKQAGTIPGKPMVERGPILDRNGRILAIQTAMDSVEAWIPYIREAQETAGLLAEILEMDEEELFTAFTTRSGSMWIKRKITPTEAARIRELQAQDRLPGIYLRQEFGRNYPEQRIAGHLIGYVGTDNVGLDGIEYALEDTLSPEPEGRHQDTLYGNQVFLTIDITIQHTAEKLAREALEEYQADSVMILVADAKNGDILASASAPDFNPNSFMDFSEKERKNLPVTFSYEPGSVFKIFSIASFLDTGSITPYTTFFCNGLYENPLLREPIACLGAHGSVDAEHILEYSCNAGAAYASDTISIEDFHMMITRFGFGKPTGLPLAGESHGLVRDPGQWSSRSKPTISFGQEILVSAMQIIQATTTFTNRGIMLRPHIIKKIVAPDGRVLEEYNREPIREVISAATADTVLNMMEAATGPAGTARRAAVEGYRMSAKTGTAEVLDPKTGTYSKEAFLASCLAILPTDDPALIVYVVIDYPKTGIYYGSRIAAPIVGAISSEILTYLGIPGEGYRVIEHPGMITLPAQQALTVGATLPDFTGFSKKDLLPLLEDHRFTLKIQGSGWVVRQYPPAGTTVTEGMTISVELQ